MPVRLCRTIHLLIRRHRDLREAMIEASQADSRARIIELKSNARGIDHPVWGGPGWKVFLDSMADVRRVVRYIVNNPLKIGLPRQLWPFVQEYDGWLPGQIRIVKPQATRRRNE